MNKPAILIAVYFSAFMMLSMPVAHAATTANQSNKVCADITQELSAGTSEGKILNELIDSKCGMNLQEAADALLTSGGDLVSVLAAALIVNPDFEYIPTIDPTAALNPTASGNTTGGNTPVSQISPINRSISPLGGGGHALDDG